VVSLAITVAAFLFLGWVAIQVFFFICTIIEGVSSGDEGAIIFVLIVGIIVYALWRWL
jgi:hypothetical protein